MKTRLSSFDKISSFLKQQTTIRVLLDCVGGFGNESSNLNLMNKIRALGFDGIFEIIYPEEGAKKFPKLLGLAANVPAFFSYEHPFYKKITLIQQAEYVRQLNANQIPIVTLGITGAYDSKIITDCTYTLDCFNKHNNFARFTNTKVFASLDPWYMHGEYPYHHVLYDDIYFLYGHKSQILLDARSRFFNMPIATLEQAKFFLKTDPIGQAYLNKTPAIQTFINGIEQNSFNVLPIYGYPFLMSYSPDYAGRFFEVLIAARYAQLNGDAKMRKALILPVFYEYDKEIEAVNLFIQSNITRHYIRGVEHIQRLVNELSIPSIFKTASLSDQSTSEIMTELKPGEILLLSMGKLPGKNLFDGLYTLRRSNVWPQIREGQGSLSTLILGGRPHLRCAPESEWEFGQDYNDDKEIMQWLKTVYNSNKGFCSYTAWSSNSTLYKVLGQFFIDAQNQESAITKYFKNLQHAALDPKNDRIMNVLNAAIELLEKSEKEKHWLYHKISLGLIDKLNGMFHTDSHSTFQIKPDPSKVNFTQAAWDTHLKIDPYTLKPIFTFRFFNDKKEVASAEFLGMPAFCLSSDKTKNNLLTTSGALSDFEILEPEKIGFVCDVLPATLSEKILYNIKQGALLGSIDGIAQIINLTLKRHHPTTQFANYISQSFYYGALFSVRLNAHLQQQSDPHQYLTAWYHAAFETGNIWLANTLLYYFSQECTKLSERLKSQSPVMSYAVNKLGVLSQLSIFAASASKLGVVETVSSVLAGASTKLGIETVGKYFLKKK